VITVLLLIISVMVAVAVITLTQIRHYRWFALVSANESRLSWVLRQFSLARELGNRRAPFAPGFHPEVFDNDREPNCMSWAIGDSRQWFRPGLPAVLRNGSLPGNRDWSYESADDLVELLGYDGFTSVTTKEHLSGSGWIVAVYFRNDARCKDFHFVRQDAQIGWSHKRGQFSAEPYRVRHWLRLVFYPEYRFVGFFRVVPANIYCAYKPTFQAVV
jgi:hypothetical protein